MHSFASIRGMSDTNWSRYVRRTSDNASGSEIEKSTGIGQSTVSRWFTNGTLPTPAHAAKFAQAYEANVLEAFVAAGFLTEDEAGMPPRPDFDFYSMVDTDEGLSAQAKIHLKNQYGLLRAASAHSRTAGARELIQNDPEIDDVTKARLLGHLGGSDVDVLYSSTATVVEHPFPRVSEAADRPEVAIAADEQGHIAGEQESHNEP